MTESLRSVPTEALFIEPAHPGTYPSEEQRSAELDHALRGVATGSYDDRIAAWAVRTLDDSTLRTLMSWLERVRLAGAKGVR